MIRREFLKSSGLAAALVAPFGAAWAQYGTSPGQLPSPTNLVVLELINFHCSRCRAVNAHAPRIAAAAAESGIDFRCAPVAWERQSIWPDRVFYAARDVAPRAQEEVRAALFEGIQRDGLQFENLDQVIAYFNRRGVSDRAKALDSGFNLERIAERARTDTVLLAESKAVRLLELSSAQAVPVFLWIRDGQITKSITPKNADDPLALAQLVISALQEPHQSPKAAS